jgi:hypothetical protein
VAPSLMSRETSAVPAHGPNSHASVRNRDRRLERHRNDTTAVLSRRSQVRVPSLPPTPLYSSHEVPYGASWRLCALPVIDTPLIGRATALERARFHHRFGAVVGGALRAVHGSTRARRPRPGRQDCVRPRPTTGSRRSRIAACGVRTLSRVASDTRARRADASRLPQLRP